MKKSSKKAFVHNLKAEEHAGKPKDQALAIAYDVQRRNKGKKKMAMGGEALTEKHDDMPMHQYAEGGKIGYSDENASKEPSEHNHLDINESDHHEMGEDFSEMRPHMFADGGQVDWEKTAKDIHKQLQQMKMEATPTPAPTPEAPAKTIPELGEQAKEEYNGAPPQMKAHGGEIEDEEEMEHKHGSIAEAIMSKNRFKHLGEEADLDANDMEGPGESRKENIEAKHFDAEESEDDYKGQPKDSNEHTDEHEEHSENKEDKIDLIRKKMKLGKR